MKRGVYQTGAPERVPAGIGRALHQDQELFDRACGEAHPRGCPRASGVRLLRESAGRGAGARRRVLERVRPALAARQDDPRATPLSAVSLVLDEVPPPAARQDDPREAAPAASASTASARNQAPQEVVAPSIDTAGPACTRRTATGCRKGVQATS